jgi:predicted Zn-dependent protease
MNTKIVRWALVAIAIAAGPWLAPNGAYAQRPEKPIDSLSDVPRKARLALFQAYEARGNGDYQKSSQILLDFLERNPGDDHFLIRYHLGNSMAQTHELKDQIEQYRKCVELEPRFAKGWLSLGETAYNAGQYALAAEALTNGFRLSEEKKPQVLYYASAAWLTAEQPEKSVPLLEELVGGEYGVPKMDWYRALVSAALQAEDELAGRRAIDGLLAQYEDDPDAWTLAFQYAAGTGDYRQAAVALQIKSYLTPLSREEQIQLGDLYASIDVPEPASENYVAAMSEQASTEELERLASAYLAAHDSEAALKTLNRALAKEPTPRLWALYGDLNFMEKKYQEAYQAYKKSSELDPQEGRAYLMMAYCAMELGDKDEVKAHLEMAAAYPEQQDKARDILSKLDLYMQ